MLLRLFINHRAKLLYKLFQILDTKRFQNIADFYLYDIYDTRNIVMQCHAS